MYPISSLSAPHNFVATMMCKLFGKADSTKFSIERVPLTDVVVNTMIMNWIHILSDNLTMAIRENRKNKNISSRTILPFYMSTSIMDAIHFCSQFPNMGWKWTA